MLYCFTDWPATVEEYQALSDIDFLINSVYCISELFVSEEVEEEEEVKPEEGALVG